MNRSPLLSLPGAVEADPPDAGVAAHYGAIVTEQRRLLAGDAWVDLSHRDVVAVGGPDRLSWLHSLTTQHLEGLAPGTPTEGLLLDPQGRVEHAFVGVDDGTTFVVHTEPGRGAALAGWLDSMRFMLRVEVTEASDAWAVVGRVDPTGSPSYELVPRAELAAWAADRPAPVGVWAWEALRIEAGRPRLGVDTDDRTIPNEVGWIGTAVHLDKGCYRGQETVARVHTLGRPPRRLVLLLLDGSAERLPKHGDPVTVDGRTVGAVGSAAHHHELGPVALAVVKRSVGVDVELTVDGIAAAQEVVVDPEVGLHARPVLG